MFLKSLRKRSRQFLLLLLTMGASLTLGLLSFTGMFVLWPLLPLAIAAFILAIAYEHEIYWQNIKGAFKTLFSKQALKKQLLREFLAKYAPDQEGEADFPQLLKDYLMLIKALAALQDHMHHHATTQEDARYQKQLKQKIKRFELAFVNHLFTLAPNQTAYTQDVEDLRAWFKKNEGMGYLNQYRLRFGAFTLGKVFSVAAGICIAVGTSYLLFDMFITLPFLAVVPVAALPAVILTLGLLSGIAYALITYNSITAMINDQTLPKLYRSLVKDYKTPDVSPWKKAAKGLSILLFFGLTLTLTVCTAGTWWTISQNLAFLIHEAWLMAFTALIMLSTFVINFFNTVCTWFGLKKEIKKIFGCALHLESAIPTELVDYKNSYLLINDNALFYIKDDATQEEVKINHMALLKENINKIRVDSASTIQLSHKQIHDFITLNGGYTRSSWAKIATYFKLGWMSYKSSWAPIDKTNDSWSQRYNPFRFLIKALLTPIEWLLFIAHVISIGVAGDQMPGIPQEASATLCAIDEFKEDWHRFFGHSHDHGPQSTAKHLKTRANSGGGHEHNLDIPKLFIQFLLSPLYLLAIVVDFFAIVSKKNSASHSLDDYLQCFKTAWTRQVTNRQPEEKAHHAFPTMSFEKTLSLSSQQFETLLLLQPLKERLDTGLIRGKVVADEKRNALNTLEDKIKTTTSPETLKTLLQSAHQEDRIKKPRFSFFKPTSPVTTTTEKGLKEIATVMFPVAASG